MKTTKNYLYITSESFGGFGGIALYNRDLITALSLLENTNEICIIQRLVREPIADLPPRVLLKNNATISKTKVFLHLISTLLNNKKYDEIICGHINLLPAAIFAKIIFKSPVTLVIYGIDAWTRPKLPLVNMLVSSCNRVISISKTTSEKFLSWAPINEKIITILYNAIHLEQYNNTNQEVDLKEKNKVSQKKILLTLGRISASERYKGFDEVIDTLQDLRREIPNLLYVVAGDGDDLPRLKKKVIDLKLNDHVLFTGKINEVQKKEWLSIADLFVMPSYGEGFGFVILEALASGTPVVASKVDGTREATKNGELGTLVDPHSKQELLNAVLSLLRGEKKVPGGVDYFSFEKFSNQVSSLYLI